MNNDDLDANNRELNIPPPPPPAVVPVLPPPTDTGTRIRRPSGPEKPSLETLTWDKVDVDNTGNVVGVFGIRFMQLSSKQLRSICSRLNIRGVKNVKKQLMVEQISNHYKNRKAYDSLDVCSSPPAPGVATTTQPSAITATIPTTRKEIQCPYRLMNVLFSDQFAERFAATGNSASRDILDTGLAGNDQHFWQCVRTAFVSPLPNATFDELMFKDDAVLSLQSDDIDPSKIVPHDWKKLRTLWKATNSEYKAALSRFTVSGTHEHEFWNFCNGRLEAYYLHKLLTLRPNLAGFVEAELPPAAALASTMTGTEITNRLNGPTPAGDASLTAQTNKRKSRSPVSEVIATFSSNADARMELQREKIRLLHKEDKRQQEHQQWKKQNEEFERQKAAVDNENSLMKQWAIVLENLRQLKKDLQQPNLTTDEEFDILEDIEGFKEKKRRLAVKLGLRGAPE